MKCYLCSKDKLRREFPFEALTEKCNHAPLHCLRCTTEYVEKNHRCSMCDKPVAIDNPTYQECIYTLKRMFPDVEAPQPIPSTTAGAPSTNQTIMVSVMGGEVTVVQFNPNMTVVQLKNRIQEHFKVKPEQQRLLFQDKELKSYKNNSQLATLLDYNVQPSSTINLVVVLYNIPDSFDEVIFDLFWGYPFSGKDYLDASVLLYSGPYFQEVVDYHRRHSKTCSGVRHSGDVMDDYNRKGHHTIRIKIKSLPEKINKLFFTLSAWNSPNISKYPNPSLKFFDARYPKKQLCDDSLTHAAYSQAIIMCSMCRIDGEWKVLSLKRLSDGNAKDYSPIQGTIQTLIQNGSS
ncbi:uncharacterized protein LOC110243697 [Exaiptasia diaphana]|uniref:Ubiquitin-like domain-containing protein n=1 Tax=Exaiptasia diaphana TaxID=2652724 RepID=A0A913XIT5_EXADI|nr:uncharacterized protein LOC110243697 [Exaiptasia diaphana]KXJ11434.1 Ubiquitin-60S ribosomal protein L40 [Exaiptasia diaphana]